MVWRKALIFILFVCCGCSTSALVYKKEEYTKPHLALSPKESPKFERVQFLVITEENFIEKTKVLSDNPVLMCLSDTDYKNLAINLDTLKQFIILQNKVIEMYKTYYEGEKK